MTSTLPGVVLHTGADGGANLTVPEFAALVAALVALALAARWFLNSRIDRGSP